MQNPDEACACFIKGLAAADNFYAAASYIYVESDMRFAMLVRRRAACSPDPIWTEIALLPSASSQCEPEAIVSIECCDWDVTFIFHSIEI